MQVGLVMLIGLAAKNAILIVEFAKAKHDQGTPLEEAALESARLRFRPILMTAFAFILGVVPLMLASGAGAGAQNVMGTAVFWGMLIATALGVFIIPGNYTFVESLGRKRSETAGVAAEARPEASALNNEGVHACFPLAGFEPQKVWRTQLVAAPIWQLLAEENIYELESLWVTVHFSLFIAT